MRNIFSDRDDIVLRRAVLCIEDDEEDRATLRAALPGYDVEFARTAIEAIRALNARQFDVYVLEFFLPDWTGPALCREIRKSDPHAPVLVYTDACSERDRARSLRAGATAFLVKNESEPAVLAARVRSLLGVSDAANVAGREEEERTIAEEISRRMAAAAETIERARVLHNAALERIVRTKAMTAFFAKHGTKAHFERAWPQIFGSARANAATKL